MDLVKDDDLIEPLLRIISNEEPRCPGCEQKLYFASSFHQCPDEKGKGRMDSFCCAKCLGKLIYVDERILGKEVLEPHFCTCESPTVKYRGE